MTYTDPQTPTPERVVEVRTERNNTGWLVAGVVAVVAVIAVAFMLTRPSAPTQDQLTQAQEQGRAVGQMEGSQTTLMQSGQAGMTAGAQQAQMSAEQAARDAAAAADSARRSTEQAAANAAQAAQDTADRAKARADADAQPAAPPQ